jgi:hypothetical protein
MVQTPALHHRSYAWAGFQRAITAPYLNGPAGQTIRNRLQEGDTFVRINRIHGCENYLGQGTS